MTVPFRDLAPQHQRLQQQLEQAMAGVINSGWFVLGKKVAEFEERFADYLGVRCCVAVASGTDAVTLSLMALDIGPGDEVITTNVTAYATITGINRAGATPIPVDIDPATGLISPARVAAAITERTRAILPVHLYGQSCDMAAIMAIADRHDLKVIEDCAQSVGATYGPARTGSLGDAGCFSFYPTKNLGCMGDGGAIVTGSEALRDRLREMRNYGQSDRYHHDGPGLNSRLDEIQAAVLLIKLQHLDDWNRRRREIAEQYRHHLHGVTPLSEQSYGRAVYHLFVVKSSARDTLMAFLEQNGIGTLIHYPVPVHRQKAFDSSAVTESELRQSIEFTDGILSLPLYPELDDAQIRRVIDTVNASPAAA